MRAKKQPYTYDVSSDTAVSMMQRQYEAQLRAVQGEMDRFISFMVMNGFDNRETLTRQIRTVQSAVTRRIALMGQLK